MDYLAFVNRQLAVYRLRLTELVVASRSIEDMNSFREYLEPRGIKELMVENVVSSTGDIFAWYVSFSK